MMSTSDRRAELEAALEASPDDRELYEVYADELQRLGDPRGELIALQLADTAETLHRATTLIAEHDFEPPLARLRWEAGFVKSAELDPADTSLDVSTVLDHPSLRFLQVLSLVAVEVGVQQAIDALASRRRPALRALAIGGVSGTSSSVPAPACDIGALAGLWPAVPNLEKLFLTGQNVSLGVLELPTLEWLVVHSTSLRDEQLAAVLDQPWLALEELVLRFGHATPTTARLEQLFTHAFPSLLSLSLHGSFLDDVIELLVRWPRLPRLQCLSLFGGLTDRGAAAIAHHARAFRHLQILDVSRNYLTPAVAATLTQIAHEVRIGDQGDLEERDLDLYDY